MSVYISNNMAIHDLGQYRTHVRTVMPTIQTFGGKLLAGQNSPQPVEGTWPIVRTVLLEFPSRKLAEQWIGSPDYQAIAIHRKAGTTSNVVILDGLK